MHCSCRHALLSPAPHWSWRCSSLPSNRHLSECHYSTAARRCLLAGCTSSAAVPAPTIAGGLLPISMAPLPVHEHEFKLVKPSDVDTVIDWYIAQGTKCPRPCSRSAVLWFVICSEPHTVDNRLKGEPRVGICRTAVAASLRSLKGFAPCLADLQHADPYWAVPWASGAALAHAILKNPEMVRGKRVADVGCGLGLGGLACALAGVPFACCCAPEGTQSTAVGM